MRILVGACALVLLVGAGAQPVLELDVPRAEDNPRAEDRALALYAEDVYNRALVCPGRRTPIQPADPTRMRCAFAPVGDIPMGRTLRAGLSGTSHEHDGMYGLTEDVVLVAEGSDGSSAIVATLTQLEVSVTDATATLHMRRQRVIAVDAGPVLCVESVVECGPGLFTVMDLGRRPWRPHARSRGIDAFVLGASQRLERASTLDGRCPTQGYAPFVEPSSPSVDPIARRRTVQGEDRSIRGRPDATCR